MDIARNTALNILIEYDRSGVFPNLSIKKHLRNISDDRDKAFISALVYGVIEKRLLLDHYISCVSSVKIKKINVTVINILRMGIYQIVFLSTPSSAACNTSVELAKKNGQYKSAAFVNAILRRLSASIDDIPISDDDLSVKYSIGHPVLDVMLSAFGKDDFIRFVESPTDNKKVFIAVNTCKISSHDLISVLKLEGLTAEKTEFDGLLMLESGNSLETSPAFKAGLYHVIGLPSFIAAHALAPKSDDFVIDMCAAPGGKTFTMAYLSDDSARITAFDVHEHKIRNLSDNCKRLSLNSIIPCLNDSSLLNEKYIGAADKILCDVPCSGLGMIFKKPDIKYKNIDFDSLIQIQYKILSNAGIYLKDGGRIVYSTCTVNPDENRGVVERFINENPEFQLDESVEIYNGHFGEYTFLPYIDGTDGFYVAVLKKTKRCFL